MQVKYDSFKDINICAVEVGDIIHTHGNHEYEYRAKTDEDNKIKLTHVRKRGTLEWKTYQLGISLVSPGNIHKIFENPFKVGNYAIYINTNRIVRVERIPKNNNSLLKVRCSWLPNVGGEGYVVDLDKLMPIEWDFNLLKEGNSLKLKDDNTAYEIVNVNIGNGTVQLKQIGQNICASTGANNLIVTMSQIETVFEIFKFVPIVIKVDTKTKFLPSELKNFIMGNLEIGDIITREGNDQFKYRVITIDPLRTSIGLDQAIRIKPPVEVHDYKTPFHIYFEDIIEIHKANPFFQSKIYFKMDKVKKDFKGNKYLEDKNINETLKVIAQSMDVPILTAIQSDRLAQYRPWTKIELPKYGSSPLDLIIVDYYNMMQTPLKTNLDSKDFLDYLNDLIKELDITKGELVDMKNFEKENMQAGKADAITKKKEYERVESEKRYTILLNQLDSVNAQIKVLEEQKKQIETEMAKFD